MGENEEVVREPRGSRQGWILEESEVTADVLTKVARNATPLREGDREILTEQLDRLPRGLVGVGARCACGKPAVTVTLPRLPEGSPFPTVFYLSLPYLVRFSYVLVVLFVFS